MIKTILFDLILWTLGYFAIVVGNVYAANFLPFAIFSLFTLVLIVFLVYVMYSVLLSTNVLSTEERLEFRAILNKQKRAKASSTRKWYGILTSTAEVTLLATFGWTFCAVAWMLMTFMMMWIRSKNETDLET